MIQTEAGYLLLCKDVWLLGIKAEEKSTHRSLVMVLGVSRCAINNSLHRLYYQRGQGHRPQVIQYLGGALFGNGNVHGIFPLLGHCATVHEGLEQLLEHLNQLFSTVL